MEANNFLWAITINLTLYLHQWIQMTKKLCNDTGNSVAVSNLLDINGHILRGDFFFMPVTVLDLMSTWRPLYCFQCRLLWLKWKFIYLYYYVWIFWYFTLCSYYSIVITPTFLHSSHAWYSWVFMMVLNVF